MVENGQDDIWPVDFASRLHARLPVEVIERHELDTRVDPANLAVPQRPSFHVLLLTRSNQGSHTVDFTDIPARRVSTALLGWLDERIQSILPGRVYDLRDVGFNALAGFIAIAATLALAWARRHRRPAC